MVKKKEPSRGDVNAPKERLSLIELLIVVAIILIIAAIAIPNLLRARMNANDSAAASSMRTINTAQVTYVTQYPGSGYAPDLTTLGPNGTKCGVVAATSTAACLLDDQLGCTTASAGPLKVNTTGTRNFCTNPDAVVRASKPGTTEITVAETMTNCADTTKYNAINN